MEVLTSCTSAANKFKCDKIGLTSKNVDPLAALEPDSSYTVTLSKGLSGRDKERILIDDHATALLSFRTEPLQINTVGNGDGEHGAEVRGGESGTGTASDPYVVADALIPLDGALEIGTNAPIDYSRLNGTSATAEVSINGGAPKAVAVTVSPNVDGDCGNLRSIYVAPAAGANWATPTNPMTDEVVVTVTLKGAAVYDLSQVKGHPIGKGIHTMGKDLVIRAKLLKGSAATDYAGALSSAIQDPNNC
jgi:hypothetical protein